jgi:hypothetical protein
MNIIKKIETNKKNKINEINKILNKNINYVITFDDDKLILLDDSNKKILVSDFIFFGIYQNDKKFWVWANSIPGISKKQIRTLRDIKNKSYLFENEKNKNIQFIYQYLNTDIIEITDNKNLDLINDSLLLISDAKVILNPINKYGNIQYIGITNILEKYN